ncbi:hypothetical protein H1C71_018513, partial [Ictidomys tridecemlineatus]
PSSATAATQCRAHLAPWAAGDVGSRRPRRPFPPRPGFQRVLHWRPLCGSCVGTPLGSPGSVPTAPGPQPSLGDICSLGQAPAHPATLPRRVLPPRAEPPQ